MPDNTHEQVAWNLSEILIRQIGGLLQKANTEFINGHIANAFTTMQTIGLLIFHDLAPEEVTAITNAEKEARDIINSSGLYIGFKVDSNKRDKYFDGRTKFITYHNLIMKALKRHGYSIPPKPDTARII